jgi:hypothetical protein
MFLILSKSERKLGSTFWAKVFRLIHAAINRLPSVGFRRAQIEFVKADLALVYVEGRPLPSIPIKDPTRSAQISSISKMKEGLRLTTNCLERINNHLNEATPRKSTVWVSLIQKLKYS